METSLQSGTIPNTITFGYAKGTLSPLQDVGGQVVIFRGEDHRIDCLQIGNTTYGNPKGGTSQPPKGGSSQLPADGTFILEEMQGINQGYLRYIKLKINGTPVTAGTKSTGNCIMVLPDLKVKFCAVQYDNNGINLLQFYLV